MLFDTGIPGFCPKEQMAFMSEIAKRVPRHGKIVEVGCLFGRSAYCWAASSHETVTVFCIDPWPGHEVTAYTGDCMRRGQPVKLNNTIHQFLSFMQDRNVKNIVTIQKESPLKNDWTQGPVDLVYIDGAHNYQAVYDDIDFWLRHLKKDGLMCGDDFILDFPETICAVHDIAKSRGFQVRRFRKMWLFIP